MLSYNVLLQASEHDAEAIARICGILQDSQLHMARVRQLYQLYTSCVHGSGRGGGNREGSNLFRQPLPRPHFHLPLRSPTPPAAGLIQHPHFISTFMVPSRPFFAPEGKSSTNPFPCLMPSRCRPVHQRRLWRSAAQRGVPPRVQHAAGRALHWRGVVIPASQSPPSASSVTPDPALPPQAYASGLRADAYPPAK